jgi:hypothetical protein
MVLVPRIPLIVRALVLVPLLAVAVDLARATLACGPRAESCLEAAGQGWLGMAAPLLLVLYAAGLALAVGGLARGATSGARTPGFLRLWLIGSAGVAAVCGGQALLAGALGDGAALGGGWPELLAFCLVAGAVLALALRIAPAAEELVRSLRPDAPRLRMAPALVRHIDAARPHGPATRFALVTRERGPPSPLD